VLHVRVSFLNFFFRLSVAASVGDGDKGAPCKERRLGPFFAWKDH